METLITYFPDIIGCLGAVIILGIYALLQLRKIKVDSFLYSFLNFISAFMILISLVYAWNLAAFLIEFIWMLLSAYGIYLYFMRDRL